MSQRQLAALRRLQSLLVVDWPDADDLDGWRHAMLRQATNAEGDLPAARAELLASGYPVPDEWLRVSAWGLARGWCAAEEYRQTLQEIEIAILRLENEPDATNAQEPRRPGRRKADYATIRQEAALAERWERAKASGEYKADFARSEGLTLRELERLLARVRKRKSSAE